MEPEKDRVFELIAEKLAEGPVTVTDLKCNINEARRKLLNFHKEHKSLSGLYLVQEKLEDNKLSVRLVNAEELDILRQSNARILDCYLHTLSKPAKIGPFTVQRVG